MKQVTKKKDISISVEFGEHLEEAIANFLAKEWGVEIKKDAYKFADIDRRVIKNGQEAYRLEIKVRDVFYEEAMFPQRKYFAAIDNAKNGVETKCICYCLNNADICYSYDLTKPLYVKPLFKRDDRETGSPHAYYAHNGFVVMEGLHKIVTDAIKEWETKNATKVDNKR